MNDQHQAPARVEQRASDASSSSDLRAILLRPRSDAARAIVTLRGSGSSSPELSRADREAMLADARAGKLVSLTLEAITFIQRKAPNRNLHRFADKNLKTFAVSFRGMPVLRDHNWRDLSARLGTIRSSKLEDHPGEEGAKQFRMELELTDPLGVELALRGQIDQFSIGGISQGDTRCSICGKAMTVGWWSVETSCEHELGEEYDGEVCQLEFTDTAGVEVSAVTVAAVEGTGVEDIRASLAAARAARLRPQKKGPTMTTATPLAAFAAILGLSADSDDEQAVLAGAQSMKAELEQARAELAVYAAAGGADLAAALAAARAELAAEKQQGQRRDVEQLIQHAFSTGRLRPGSALEGEIRRTAGISMVAAQEMVDAIPANHFTPVGLARQSAGADPTPRTNTLSAQQREVNKLIGVTDDAVTETIRKEG